MLYIFKPFLVFDKTRAADQVSTYGKNRSPTVIYDEAKFQLEVLLRLSYLRHSFIGYDPWSMVIGLTLSSIMLAELSTNQEFDVDLVNSRRSTLILGARLLRDQSRCIFVAEAMFCIVRDRSKPEDANLMRNFAKFDGEGEPRQQLVAEHIKSIWPLQLGDDGEETELGQLVLTYKQPEEDGVNDSSPDVLSPTSDSMMDIDSQD